MAAISKFLVVILAMSLGEANNEANNIVSLPMIADQFLSPSSKLNQESNHDDKSDGQYAGNITNGMDYLADRLGLDRVSLDAVLAMYNQLVDLGGGLFDVNEGELNGLARSIIRDSSERELTLDELRTTGQILGHFSLDLMKRFLAIIEENLPDHLNSALAYNIQRLAIVSAVYRSGQEMSDEELGEHIKEMERANLFLSLEMRLSGGKAIPIERAQAVLDSLEESTDPVSPLERRIILRKYADAIGRDFGGLDIYSFEIHRDGDQYLIISKATRRGGSLKPNGAFLEIHTPISDGALLIAL